jgi:hypothetical protein
MGTVQRSRLVQGREQDLHASKGWSGGTGLLISGTESVGQIGSGMRSTGAEYSDIVRNLASKTRAPLTNKQVQPLDSPVSRHVTRILVGRYVVPGTTWAFDVP